MSHSSAEQEKGKGAERPAGAEPPTSALEAVDPDVFRAVRGEVQRQRDVLELIASENFTSPAVLEATGSVLTNKYAEGLPGKRYYGGCEHVDVVEELARDRATRLFGADHANVQPHSGAQANMAAYFAFLEPGDSILGMDLSHGGHLTHGSPVNFSGKLYRVSHYGVRRSDERVDVDGLAELAREEDPRLIVAGWSAYPRILPFEDFASVAADAGCPLLVDMAHFAGLVAGGVHPSPVPHADVVTTTTHKTLRGPRAGLILCTEEHAGAIDKAVFPRTQGGPLMHVIAAKAVCLKEAATDEFQSYARRIVENARALGERLASHGYKLVSGGTDTHLLLVDLRENTDLTGKDAEEALEAADITVNKNTVPFEERSPFVTSGIRIGTPALTTRGMGAEEMAHVGDLIHRVLSSPEDEAVRERVRGEVSELCESFPLYPVGGGDAGADGSGAARGFVTQTAALSRGRGE